MVAYELFEMIAASDQNSAVSAQKGFKVKLQDPKFILKIIFMYKVSSVITVLSKEFQKQDTFPTTSKHEKENCLSHLHEAQTQL